MGLGAAGDSWDGTSWYLQEAILSAARRGKPRKGSSETSECATVCGMGHPLARILVTQARESNEFIFSYAFSYAEFFFDVESRRQVGECGGRRAPNGVGSERRLLAP